MSHHITMSGLGRAMLCQWWAHASTPHDRRSGQEATDGTDDHALLERAVSVGLRPDDPAWLVAAVGSLGEKSTSGPPERYVTEQAVAYHPLWGTGRALPKSAHRDYGDDAEAGIPGTVDVCWPEVTEDPFDQQREIRTLVVRDWKTGPEAEETTDLPSDSAQLAGLALALLGDEGLYYDEGITEVRLEMALTGPTRPEPTVWDYRTTPQDLDARWRERILRAMQSTEDDDPPTPHAGPHCKWCPAVAACPEAQSALAAVEHASSQDVERLLLAPIQTDEQCARLHVRIKLAEELLDRVKDRRKEYVREHGPVAIGEGKVLRLNERSSKRCSYTKLPPELQAAAEACGALSVSFYEELREGNAERRPRKKKAAAGAVAEAQADHESDGEAPRCPGR